MSSIFLAFIVLASAHVVVLGCTCFMTVFGKLACWTSVRGVAIIAMRPAVIIVVKLFLAAVVVVVVGFVICVAPFLVNKLAQALNFCFFCGKLFDQFVVGSCERLDNIFVCCCRVGKILLHHVVGLLIPSLVACVALVLEIHVRNSKISLEILPCLGRRRTTAQFTACFGVKSGVENQIVRIGDNLRS